jgi:hypothetical protein
MCPVRRCFCKVCHIYLQLITKGFKVTKGLRQGCSLSPTLQNMRRVSVKELEKEMSTSGYTNSKHNTHSLSFADDQVLLAQDHDDMEYMARKLKEEYKEWGLTINLEKTKCVCIGGEKETL